MSPRLAAVPAAAVLLVAAILALARCTDTQLATAQQHAQRDGQLFCAWSTANGPMIAGLVQAVAPAAGAAGPVIVLATGATQAAVQAACAAAHPGAVPVAPPPAGVVAPDVAVVLPAPAAPAAP